MKSSCSHRIRLLNREKFSQMLYVKLAQTESFALKMCTLQLIVGPPLYNGGL